MLPSGSIDEVPVLEVPLKGRLDSDAVPEIANFLASLDLPVAGILRLDLTEVSYMGSLGLRMIVERGKAMKGLGGTLQLQGIQPRVEKSLRSAGLDRFFEIPDRSRPEPVELPAAKTDLASEVAPATDAKPEAVGSRDAELVIEMPNQLGCIQPAITQLRTFLEEHNAAPDAVYVLEMAAEELLTNVVKYAFRDDAEHVVVVTICISGGTVRLDVEDDGMPFDPHNAPKPDLSLGLEEMPIGGLGLHLVQELSEGTAYERVADKNRTSVFIGLLGKSMAAYE